MHPARITVIAHLPLAQTDTNSWIARRKTSHASRDLAMIETRPTMSFEIKLNESVRKSVRRVARKQADQLVKEFGKTTSGTRDKAIHAARKSAQRLRALLRLVRPVIGRRIY